MKKYILPIFISVVFVAIFFIAKENKNDFTFNYSSNIFNNNLSLLAKADISPNEDENINFSEGEIIDQGKWIDAREGGSYYAHLHNSIRDESGRIHIYYCSSGEPFDSGSAPDWRKTAEYETDKIRYQYSDDNGENWSPAEIIIEASRENGQSDLAQGGCGNAIVYFEGYYYLYFESYTDPSKILSIFVARSRNPEGPFKILTDEGWKNSPTEYSYKPVLESNILSLAGHDYINDNYFTSVGYGNPYLELYGAGIPRVTTDGENIYLYYVDTTYFLVWTDPEGNIYKYNRSAEEQIPYQMVSKSNDPTDFENSYSNRLTDAAGLTNVFNQFDVKYVPSEKIFKTFYFDKETDSIITRSSADGVKWTEEEALYSVPSNYDVDTVVQDNIIQTNPEVRILSTPEGYLNPLDLYLTFYKEYLLSGGPVGLKDKPTPKWYYGGYDIYGIKIDFENPGEQVSGSWDCNSDGEIDCWDNNNDGNADSFDTTGNGRPNMWDTNYDGEVDCYDTTSDGECNMGKTSGSRNINWWLYGDGICYDTNSNGNCDNFDTDGDAKMDAWNSNDQTDWGKPNMWDTNGDEQPDCFDTTGNGRPNMWDTNYDGEVDCYDTTGNGKCDY